MPVTRPAWDAMCAIRRVVVLLPLVPVIATTGMRGDGTDGSGPNASARSALSSRREAVASSYVRYLAELEELVNIDCGSYTPDGVNAIATHVEAELSRMGAEVERIPHRASHGEQQLGDLVVGRLGGTGPRLLLIGHMDTVFGPGTAVERPFRRHGDRATGPGSSDMK